MQNIASFKYFCQRCRTESNLQISTRQTQIAGYSIKQVASHLQKLPGHQSLRKTEKLLQIEDLGDMTAKCSK